MSLRMNMRRTCADPRIDPERLSPAAQRYYCRIWWHWPPIRPFVTKQWDFVEVRLDAGEPAEAISRWMEDEYDKSDNGPDDPYTLEAKAFARGLVSQVVAARMRGSVEND